MSQQLDLAEESEEYRQFVEKFKQKKTTDDCYTPPEIYQVVFDYVTERYGIDQNSVVRPFWPGGDYQAEEYPDGCCVVDNPPFSILSKIVDFYIERSIPFFLFCPTLTAISNRRHVMKLNHIICHTSITYENGAKVNTSFVTNMDKDGTVLESNPILANAINEADKTLQHSKKRHVPKYEYPDAVITAAKVNWFCAHGVPFKLSSKDCVPIACLDAMKDAGRSGIYGGGLLLSERAAAERAAAERAAAERAAAIVWELSDREKTMQKMLA